MPISPPICSVVTAVYNPSRDHLVACLESVRGQTLSNIEHVVVDDGSTAPHVADVLAAAVAADPRVRVVTRATNGGIVAASNDALAASSGTFVAFVDHDDVIEPDAIATMVDALHENDLAYSDHDLIMPNGHYGVPSFKPAFSPEQLRNQNYILHFVVARRALVTDVGGFRPGFDGAQDHDLLLRLTERTSRIAHVPRILYHWRQSGASVATDAANKPWAFEAGQRAVQEHCDRSGIDAVVSIGDVAGAYVLRRVVDPPARVSVVIPTRGGSRPVWGVTRCFVYDAVKSLVERSSTADLEFVVVYDDVTPQPVLDALQDLAGDRLVLVEYTGAFNFSRKVNAGVKASNRPLLLILNDDTELIEPDSIDVLAAHLDDPGVGMVGPKLLFADGTVQDGGHVYNRHLLPGMTGWHGERPGPGPLRPLAVEREVSGVTAAAAMVTRDLYDAMGGFDESIPVSFNDVDLCLRIRATGRRIIWTPRASWYHFESQTRPPVSSTEEFDSIDAKWHHEINNDPYCNPNFAPFRNDWLELPFKSGAPTSEPETSTSNWLQARLTGAGAQPSGSRRKRLRRNFFRAIYSAHRRIRQLFGHSRATPSPSTGPAAPVVDSELARHV